MMNEGILHVYMYASLSVSSGNESKKLKPKTNQYGFVFSKTVLHDVLKCFATNEYTQIFWFS